MRFADADYWPCRRGNGCPATSPLRALACAAMKIDGSGAQARAGREMPSEPEWSRSSEDPQAGHDDQPRPARRSSGALMWRSGRATAPRPQTIASQSRRSRGSSPARTSPSSPQSRTAPPYRVARADHETLVFAATDAGVGAMTYARYFEDGERTCVRS